MRGAPGAPTSRSARRGIRRRAPASTSRDRPRPPGRGRRWLVTRPPDVELASTARVRLADSLAHVLGDRFVPEPGTKPDYYGDGIVVSGFGLLERCPRRAAIPADDFVDSVATARRRVGLARAPPSRRRRQRRTRRRDGGRRGADRCRRLAGPAAQAGWTSSTGPAAQRWPPRRSPGARRCCDWSARDPWIRWADPSSASHWNVPDRLVQLTATHDGPDGRGRPGRTCAGRRRWRGWSRRPDPCRVPRARAGGGHPARTGPGHAGGAVARRADRRSTVDADLLDLAVDRVTEHVAHRADPDRSPARAGPMVRALPPAADLRERVWPASAPLASRRRGAGLRAGPTDERRRP